MKNPLKHGLCADFCTTAQFCLTVGWGRFLFRLMMPLPTSAAVWQRNTFPDQGHASAGFFPGYGWDTVENTCDLSVSAVDPDWRAFADNEWSTVIAEDGINFKPLPMPYIGPPGSSVVSIVFSRYDASPAYLLLAHDYWENISTEASPTGLWRSTDRCKTWEHIYRPPAGGVAFDPSDPNRLIGSWTRQGYIVRSEDAGETWTDTGFRNPMDVQTGIHWSRTDADRVYCGRMKSADGGTTWTDIGKCVMAVSDRNADTIVGVSNVVRDVSQGTLGLCVSTNGGSSWVALPDPPAEAVPGTTGMVWEVTGTARMWHNTANELLAIDPLPEHDPSVNATNRLQILLAGRSGIYEYNAPNADGSGSETDWQIRTSGLESNAHYSAVQPVPWMGFVAFDPRFGHETTVYAAKTMDDVTQRNWASITNANHTYPGGDNFEPFYRSTDGGTTWKKLHGTAYPDAPQSAMMYGMTVDSLGRLFAAACEGIYVFSSDETAQDDYSRWCRSYSWPDSESSGPLADPDGDGESNLMEYAAGTDPLDSKDYFNALLDLTGDSTSSYSFYRASPFLNYRLMQSTNLTDWLETEIPPGPGNAVVQISLPADMDRLFLRLKILEK